ncbi:DUF229 domain-containing protein [Thalassotalea litorea]|uniref:DUF229 domain-containing protein n=1 Tax=Thalassotalea litorea TaxID=2020715 RepID=A0A5R9ID22_9GAMM|nr:sulfatase-like hydrolase/transferase [Thalassotalea litorea]TLU61485.1 DUF229 domain-containing protein [Thalassotalea litorea]
MKAQIIYRHINAIGLVLMSSLLLITLEWLFFLTKPSFLSYYPLNERIFVLLNSYFLLSIILLALYCVIIIFISPLFLIKAPPDSIKNIRFIFIPVLIFSVIVFLILDNNTYILFGFASYTVSNFISRVFYVGILVGLAIYFYRKFNHWFDRLNVNRFAYKKLICSFTFIFIFIMSSMSVILSAKPSNTPRQEVKSDKDTRQLPNIIIFSADGVNSKQMSVYGFQKSTTPFFETIKDELAIFQNHYTNSEKTTGSIGALLTGKLPTHTKVIFRPDAFRGPDRFEHLPAILKNLGYYNIDISVRHYVDAEDLDLNESFNYANDRYIYKRTGVNRWLYIALPGTSKFIESIWDRLSFRFYHLSYLNKWKNPFQIVTQADDLEDHLSDIPRMQTLLDKISKTPPPFFINVHLLGPHGNKFIYEKPIFTRTKSQPKGWMMEHYNNAIYQWDEYAKQIYSALEKQQQLENTLLIFNSDHGLRHSIKNSLPLMIRFPGKAVTGVVNTPSQRIDIAPTILDYLDISQPSWMIGQSLLKADRVHEPIFIAGASFTRKMNNQNWKVSASLEPPYYSLGTLSIIYCGHLATLNLIDESEQTMTTTNLEEAEYPCPRKDFTPKEAEDLLRQHLQENYPKI